MPTRTRVLALVAVLCAVLVLPWHSFLGSVEAQSGTAIQVDVAANRRADRPPRLRGELGRRGTAGRPQRPRPPLGRQLHHPPQLEDQRRQPGQRLVLREHPRQRRRGRRVRRLRPAVQAERLGAHGDHPAHRLGGQERAGRDEARQLLRRQVRGAAGLRLELVPRRLQRRPDERQPTSPATTPTTRTCRRTPSTRRSGRSTSSPAGAPRRTAACATTSTTTSPASGTRTHRDVHPAGADDDRAAGPDDRLRHRDPAGRPRGRLRGTRGVGLVGLLLLRLRPEVRQRHRVLVLRARQDRERGHGLHALAARPDAPARAERRATACSTSSPCTTTRRAASSATTPRPPCRPRRNRSTRSLWDPSYTDETWIGDKVRLIPRMKEWVSAYYPGLETGITEYSWGADGHINGATAQADVLGIFGREGLDVGTRWVVPDTGTPTFKAIQMYRNYDGSKSVFGDTSVKATVPNPDTLAAFAAERTSDGAAHRHGHQQGDHERARQPEPRQLHRGRDRPGVAAHLRQRDPAPRRRRASPGARSTPRSPHRASPSSWCRAPRAPPPRSRSATPR